MRHLPVILILLFAVAATAAPQRTTRKGLRAAPGATGLHAPCADTIRGACTDSITLAGYDKPLRSRHETMFVTNRSRHNITGLGLTLSYYDSHGRKLHGRSISVAVELSASDTRQIAIPSWDRQQAFYYHRSSRPRKADATPYDVRIDIDYILASTSR